MARLHHQLPQNGRNGHLKGLTIDVEMEPALGPPGMDSSLTKASLAVAAATHPTRWQQIKAVSPVGHHSLKNQPVPWWQVNFIESFPA